MADPDPATPNLPTLTGPACGNCKHFTTNGIEPDPNRGLCLRWPPTVFMTNINRDPITQNILNYGSASMFPVVMVGARCGEWSSREVAN